MAFSAPGQLHSPRGWAQIAATLLILEGAAGFFGAAIVSIGEFKFFNHLEWPIGFASDVTRTPEGNLVVPLQAANRVQIYDSQRHFIRGWQIEAAGGIFMARALPDHTIEVNTSRTHKHLIYDQKGNILSEAIFPKGGRIYSTDSPPNASDIYIPTHWWLLPMTGPFYSWVCMMAGAALIAATKKKKRDTATVHRAQ
jgi:hypothetical protein